MKVQRLLKRAFTCIIALALSFGIFSGISSSKMIESSASKISDAKQKVDEYQAQQDEYCLLYTSDAADDV